MQVTTAHLEVCVWVSLQSLAESFLQHLQAVLQLLLEELEQQVARQQQLMVRERIRVVLTALTIHLHKHTDRTEAGATPTHYVSDCAQQEQNQCQVNTLDKWAFTAHNAMRIKKDVLGPQSE
jgi:hypothetical protein